MSLRSDIMRFSVLGFRSDIRIELQAPVHGHAADSDRSCENAHLYRFDLALAARMYVSSIDLNCLVHKDSFRRV